jgi:hypothetical protein
MRRTQREAETLARAAGQAAAAAKLALERTGSAYELDVVVPTSAAADSVSALAFAKERLHLAAAAWSELDETTMGQGARLIEERRRAEG